jgi:hypothetical protein
MENAKRMFGGHQVLSGSKMLENTWLPQGIFGIENGGHQEFSRLKMLENTW